MRIKICLAGALALLLAFPLVPAPAHAKSLFETLFGSSKPAKRSSAAPIIRRQISKRNNARPSHRALTFGRYQGVAPRSTRRSYTSGSYRTVCVRACDGFYFPISTATSRSRFYKDARTCRSRCGSAASLFYMPRYAGDINKARDMSGRPYDQIENAFKYRKKLVNGCACRPMPWSATERARHRRYAYIKAVKDSYALAEARTKKLREEQKQAAAKKRAIALVAEQEQDAQMLEGFHLDDTAGSRSRWLKLSKKYAAPYYAIGRAPKVYAVSEYPETGEPSSYHFSSQSMDRDSARRGAKYTFGSSGYNRPVANKKSKARAKARGPRVKARKKKKTASAFKGFFAQQKSKYSWPGD